MTVRLGLLSTARINDAVIAGVAGSDAIAVTAVGSRDEARGWEYARSRDIPRAIGGYDALLADPEVDAVYISLPNGPHLEWTRRALQAGKHVLCEKPLGRDPEAVAEVFALAAQRGLVLSEAFMYRHHPQTRRLVELVADGAIGELRTIHSHFSFPLQDPGDVRLSAELQGGALMDLGCYCVSASRLLAGEPQTVRGVQVTGGDGVDVSFAGAMGFAGGVLADFHCSFRAVDAYGLQLTGTTGRLTVADPWHIREPGIALTDADGTRTIAVEAADSYRLEAEDLARAITDGPAHPPLLGRDDAVGQAATIAALYASADT
jgi:D-xylose 1-dehydrogenase (NADP+, D-xylono-1,5-lactone-forming)